jgi:hypothetical protein
MRLKIIVIKGFWYKAAYVEPLSVLGASAYSPSTIRPWIDGLKKGRVTCEAENWSERPHSDLAGIVQARLEKDPFTSAHAWPRTFAYGFQQ